MAHVRMYVRTRVSVSGITVTYDALILVSLP
jgi:hypothetical protein